VKPDACAEQQKCQDACRAAKQGGPTLLPHPSAVEASAAWGDGMGDPLVFIHQSFTPRLPDASDAAYPALTI
jgi:hypothetical protein